MARIQPGTMEAFSSQGDGTLTVVKENSPTSFVVEQTVQTMPSAKTMTLDTKTGQILLIAAEYRRLPLLQQMRRRADAEDAAGEAARWCRTAFL